MMLLYETLFGVATRMSIIYFLIEGRTMKIKRKYDSTIVNPDMSRTDALSLLPSFLWYSSAPWGELINPHLFGYTQFDYGTKPHLSILNSNKEYLEHLRTGSDTKGRYLAKLTGKLFGDFNGPHPEFTAGPERSQVYARSGCSKNALVALDIDNKENRYSQSQMDEIASYVATELLPDAYYEPSTCEAGRTVYFVFNRNKHNKACLDSFFKGFLDSIKTKLNSKGWDSDYLVDGFFGHTPEKLFRLPRFTNINGDFHKFFNKPLTFKKLCDSGLGNYQNIRHTTSTPKHKVQFNWSTEAYYLNKGHNLTPVFEFSKSPFIVEPIENQNQNNKDIYCNGLFELADTANAFKRTQQLWLSVFFKHGKKLNGKELCDLYEHLGFHSGNTEIDKKERLSRCDRIYNFFSEESQYGGKSKDFMQFLKERYLNVNLTKDEVTDLKEKKLSAFKGCVYVEDVLMFLWMVESAKAVGIDNRFTVGINQMIAYGDKLHRDGILKTRMTSDKASFVRKIAQVKGYVNLIEGEGDGRCRRYVPSESSPVRMEFMEERGDDLATIKASVEDKPFELEYWETAGIYVEVWRDEALIKYRPSVRPPKSNAIWFSNLTYSDGGIICRTPKWITEDKIPKKASA